MWLTTIDVSNTNVNGIYVIYVTIVTSFDNIVTNSDTGGTSFI